MNNFGNGNENKNQGNRKNEKWVQSEGSCNISMEQLVGCAQAAAKRTIQTGHRMKEATWVKNAFIWRKEIEQREHSDDRKPRNEPTCHTCFCFHAVHASVVPNRQNTVKLGKFFRRLNFQKKLASNPRLPNIAAQFAVRRFA